MVSDCSVDIYMVFVMLVFQAEYITRFLVRFGGILYFSSRSLNQRSSTVVWGGRGVKELGAVLCCAVL